MSPLYLIRIPSHSGPVIRLSGPLTVDTSRHLEHELARLAVLRHPCVTVNLSACSRLDQSGMLALLELAVRLERVGRHLLLVAGEGAIARELEEWGVAEVIPVFPTEDAVTTPAARPESTPPDWTEARRRTLSEWRAAGDALKRDLGAADALQRLTGMLPVCDLADEISREQCGESTPRRRFCPLYYALGGRPGDIGCRSLLRPLLEAVESGDREAAVEVIDDVLDTIARMELPEENALPAPVGLFGMDVVPRAMAEAG